MTTRVSPVQTSQNPPVLTKTLISSWDILFLLLFLNHQGLGSNRAVRRHPSWPMGRPTANWQREQGIACMSVEEGVGRQSPTTYMHRGTGKKKKPNATRDLVGRSVGFSQRSCVAEVRRRPPHPHNHKARHHFPRLGLLPFPTHFSKHTLRSLYLSINPSGEFALSATNSHFPRSYPVRLP